MFLGSGVIVSTIFIVIISILSWICSEFVIEGLSLTNAILFLKNNEENIVNTEIEDNS